MPMMLSLERFPFEIVAHHGADAVRCWRLRLKHGSVAGSGWEDGPILEFAAEEEISA